MKGRRCGGRVRRVRVRVRVRVMVRVRWRGHNMVRWRGRVVRGKGERLREGVRVIE
jgi:hypothetical protein